MKSKIESTSIQQLTLEDFVRVCKTAITHELAVTDPIAKAQAKRRLSLIRKYEVTGDELALAIYIRGHYVNGLVWGGSTEEQIREVIPPIVIQFLMKVSERYGEDAVSDAVSEELHDRIQQVETMLGDKLTGSATPESL